MIQLTLGFRLHPPLLNAHSSISIQDIPSPVYPLGHGPHVYEPGKLIHVEIQWCLFSAHSSISTVHAGVKFVDLQPCSQMQV